ncbi:unnamed protein product [Vitrella brassicaformis CCMP3155]|uniref:Protein kinase domain-containing protein n=1 Tax=Vitrella brassicaformis (strain CCMP3155) TaxID=1169540 RepID=A0A0G4GF37_VITBC|nr:unnamed protein product [Vitrella brassicaformis CCMP3155]|eukprot:CEM28105.1 unnamed protein product [Vitrella brassicaformis CCMP3155]
MQQNTHHYKQGIHKISAPFCVLDPYPTRAQLLGGLDTIIRKLAPRINHEAEETMSISPKRPMQPLQLMFKALKLCLGNCADLRPVLVLVIALVHQFISEEGKKGHRMAPSSSSTSWWASGKCVDSWQYRFDELEYATHCFRPDYCLGAGVYGTVFKGNLRGDEYVILQIERPPLAVFEKHILTLFNLR